ncbi:MAG TPA: carbohydrate-binding family 9-like protein, partial [Salinimicrobium sp.]|nr:carbohydrate-binding family 9-like protein [Salinimicrobium sp.]
ANIHNEIPKNEFWRINFSRVNWDFELIDGNYHRKKDKSGNFLPEYNWVWSPQYVINMHEPEKWGYVYFSTKQPGKKDHFTIPKDEHIKWALYKLYRKQNSYFRKNEEWAKTIELLVENPIKILGKEIRPNLEFHLTGWNIWVKSPFTGKILVVKEDGEFVALSKNRTN